MAVKYVPDGSEAIKKYYEQGFNLKTIVTGGYYGTDGVRNLNLKEGRKDPKM